MPSRLFVLASLLAAAAGQSCYDGYCCDGSIVVGCSNGVANALCCQGDTTQGVQVCVGNGDPTCSAGKAVALTAATAAAPSGTSISFGSSFFGSSSSASGNFVPGSSAGPTGISSSAAGTGGSGPTATTPRGPTQTTGTAGTAGDASSSASASATDNAAAGRNMVGGAVLGAVPLAWLLGGA
jgi:hypothetical protein